MRRAIDAARRAAAGLSICAALLCPTGRATAADPALRDAASMAGAAMFLDSGAPGLILAVVSGQVSYIEGFGETAPGSKTEPNGASLFRIGSVSKVLAGDVLAAMVAERRIELTDPLARYAPSGVTLKSVGDRPITLLDLATRSAGLPREAPDPAQPSGGNPFAVFKGSYYWRWLAENAPAYTPGSTALYSNLGFGLLGEALAKVAGKPYPELLRERITAPFGMGDTVARLSEQQKARLMVGLDLANQADPNWEASPVMAASGGLYSTADDMVKWMRWHLADDAGGHAARSLAHALWRPHDGMSRLVGVEATDTVGMGLGWVVSPARDGVPFLLGKSGGLGGFMSYVVLSPNRRLGIFVVTSRVNFAMFEGLRQGVRTLAAELAPATH